MSISDYRRPASHQIYHHYQCSDCGNETETLSIYESVDVCHCGGAMTYAGESYPADVEEWDEERDNLYDEWRPRR